MIVAADANNSVDDSNNSHTDSHIHSNEPHIPDGDGVIICTLFYRRPIHDRAALTHNVPLCTQWAYLGAIGVAGVIVALLRRR